MAGKNETPQQTFQNTTSEEVKPRFWPPQARKFWYFSPLCARFLMVFWLITSRISKKNRLRRAYCSRRWKFCGLRALQRVFCLTKWAPQAKILRFESATKGILPYKMSAAGENFGVWREKIKTPHIRFEIQNLEILKPDVDKNKTSAWGGGVITNPVVQ